MAIRDSFTDMGVVLVGVDGSPGAKRAVRNGVHEAHRRGAKLHLLYAVPPLYGLTGLDPEQDDHDLEEYRSILSSYVEYIKTIYTDLEVESSVVLDDPAYALVKATHSADLLVLGGRSLNSVKGAVVGSVTNKVLPYAACPVMIAHPREYVHEGPVVVGIAPESGSPNTLRYAFEEARRRERPLFILSARQHTSAAASLLRTRDRRRRAEAAIQAAVERTREAVKDMAKNYPEVSWELSVVEDHASEVLIKMSEDASVTIVGSQGKVGRHGLIGSVSLSVVREASLAIVVPESLYE